MPLTLQEALKKTAAANRTVKAAYKQQKGAALKLLPFERIKNYLLYLLIKT